MEFAGMFVIEEPNAFGTPEERNERRAERESLIREIEQEFQMTASITGREKLDPVVKKALEAVPRHAFVPEPESELAYLNRPLPIGYRQTISQPFIVAIMTDLLEVQPQHVVLEVGTGSGYQAAVLSHLARQVYSIEVVDALANTAAERLRALGYDNVEVRSGDGSQGWSEHSPFDRIIVTAAGPEIPPTLIEQLAPEGRLVAPVGDRFMQSLVVLEKAPDGETSQHSVLPVAFVPLTHGTAHRV